ncbi:hypothetical protein DVH24_013662 [Malus domestica]|uniref:Uncharacterized protein n=1 Tax=Malus domestica TaxID=3750 RepID=A0A498JD45_MALDO|nr:hypothetical protein DVH24_013662 [Malus domestica]
MSKFSHETKSFNSEFHEWYNMEPPLLPRLPKANPIDATESINQVRDKLDSETGVAEYWNHKLIKAEKELVDLNGEVNEGLYSASKQKTKAGICGERITFLNFELFQKHRGHIESYEHSREGNA